MCEGGCRRSPLSVWMRCVRPTGHQWDILRGDFPVAYNQPFPLWFQLESIAGTGFGPGRNSGVGTSTADFLNTAAIEGLLFYDANMNPLQTPVDITSALGISYQQIEAVPEPGTLTLLGIGAIGVLTKRRRWRKRHQPSF